MTPEVVVTLIAFVFTAIVQIAAFAWVAGQVKANGDANRKAIAALTSRVDQHSVSIVALQTAEAIRHPGQQLTQIQSPSGAD
jgi:hypothetical protein